MSKHNNNNGNKENSKEDSREEKEVTQDTLPENLENETIQDEKDQETCESSAQEDKPGNEEPGWEQKTADLESKLTELNDQYLRKAADFENFRKRTIKEKQELSDFANQNFILDLLPVLDDFDRAIKSGEASKDFNAFFDGVTMIQKRLSGELEKKWGLKRFDSEGEPFDPGRHEALQVEKVSGIEEPIVKDDFLKGYLLKDRVIRFAKVKVLMPEEGDSGLETEDKK